MSRRVANLGYQAVCNEGLCPWDSGGGFENAPFYHFKAQALAHHAETGHPVAVEQHRRYYVA